jgi:hypothetical protein
MQQKNNSANKYIILLNNTIFLLINFFGSFKFCVGKLYNIIKKADKTKRVYINDLKLKKLENDIILFMDSVCPSQNTKFTYGLIKRVLIK